MQIIDTHQHLWDLSQFHLPWTNEEPKLKKSFLMKDYLSAATGLGIEKTIYMEVDLDSQQQRKETEYVGQMCQQEDNPMVAAVVSGRPGEEGFREYTSWLGKQPHVKGLRRLLHVPETPPRFCLDKKFIDDVAHLGDLGLSFDICIRPLELADAAKLIDACPATRFVLDHCGNAEVRAPQQEKELWKQGLAEVAQRENVVCKISGFIKTVGDGPWDIEADIAPVINHVHECFGPKRVMFAGDWPVCTLAVSLNQWVSTLREVVSPWSQAEQQQLFSENAIRFYSLY